MVPFGTLVPARFPFADLSGEKRRPALGAWRDQDRRAGLAVCSIAAVPRERPGMAALEPAHATGLKRPSVVRVHKLATLEGGVFAGRIGEAPPASLDAQATSFFGVFGHRVP